MDENMVRYSDGFAKIKDASIEELEARFREGDSRALYAIVGAYRNGTRGAKKDINRAVQVYE